MPSVTVRALSPMDQGAWVDQESLGPGPYLHDRQLRPQVGLQAAFGGEDSNGPLPPNQNEHFRSCHAPLAAPRTLAGSGP